MRGWGRPPKAKRAIFPPKRSSRNDLKAPGPDESLFSSHEYSWRLVAICQSVGVILRKGKHIPLWTKKVRTKIKPDLGSSCSMGSTGWLSSFSLPLWGWRGRWRLFGITRLNPTMTSCTFVWEYPPLRLTSYLITTSCSQAREKLIVHSLMKSVTWNQGNLQKLTLSIYFHFKIGQCVAVKKD